MTPWEHDRETWEQNGYRIADHTSNGPVNWAEVEYVVIHYTGGSSTPQTTAAVRDHIRAQQRDYVDNRGYSVGYNVEVSRLGEAWEARGEDFRCAANGNSTTNRKGFAILCLVNGAEPASAAMIAKVREVVAWANQRAGRTLAVIGHRDVRATACPGAGLYGQVQAGVFLPATTPPPEEIPVEYMFFRTIGSPSQVWFTPGFGVAYAVTAPDQLQKLQAKTGVTAIKTLSKADSEAFVYVNSLGLDTVGLNHT